MDFDSILGTISRHRLMAIIGVVLAIVAGVAAAMVTEPSYKTEGSVLLIPPTLTADQAKETGRFGGQNPLLGFDNTLVINSRLVVQALQDPAVAKQLHDAGATSTYVLETSVDQVSPLVIVKASGTDRASVIETANVVMNEVGTYLVDEQEKLGAPADTFITTRPLTNPDSPSRSSSTRLFRAGLAAAAVLALTALLMTLVDRRQRQEGAGHDSTLEADPGPTAVDAAPGSTVEQPVLPGAAAGAGGRSPRATETPPTLPGPRLPSPRA